MSKKKELIGFESYDLCSIEIIATLSQQLTRNNNNLKELI
jgi:hypothetical protein